MRKFIVVLLSLVVMVTVVGCSGEAGGSGEKGSPNTNINKDLAEINIISREEGSGTRATFEKLIGFNQKNDEGKVEDSMVKNATIKNGNAEVSAQVVENETSIGYISFVTLEEHADSVKGLTVDGIEPTLSNVLSGDYPLARPFNMIYDENDVTDVEAAFIKFIKSIEGAKVIETEGGIADMSGRESFNSASYGNLAGDLALGGSTSAEGIVIAVAEEFAALFANVTFTYDSSASEEGIKKAEDRTYTIGFASRIIKPDELGSGIKSEVICMDGIAVIVNPANEATDISKEQIKGVYTGIIKDWSELNK